MSMACSRPRAKKTTLGPLPDTIDPSAPASSPVSQRLPQLRPQRAGRLLQVVVQRDAQGIGVAGPSAAIRSSATLGSDPARPARSRSHSAYTRGVDSPPSATATTQSKRPRPARW